MKKIIVSSMFRAGVAAAAILAAGGVAKANPFASCITNNAGTISFFLNESNATVTVTYEDGSTNANFNGITTGTNVARGSTNFLLGSHTSYAITVTKNGSGTPSLIASGPVVSAIGNTRGVAANNVPTSPGFGRVYDAVYAVGVYLLNSDLSSNGAPKTLGFLPTTPSSGSTLCSPDWVSVTQDGSVLVVDENTNHAAVYICPPDLSSSQPLLAGTNNATNSLVISDHGIITGPAILTGSVSNGNAVLYTVDGNLGTAGLLQVYNIGAGPLPWSNAPVTGPQISIPGLTANALGGNEYNGFSISPNGDIYASTYRSSAGSANWVTITDPTGTNVLWSSEGLFGYPTTSPLPTSGDWFIQTAAASGGLTGGSAVSPDGKYLAALTLNNYMIIAPLTNGIPDVSKIYVVTPTSTTSQARGIAWDAAGNILMSSSGLGYLQEYSLGGSSTCVTTGNANGTTGFTITQPSTLVSVVAVTNTASQGGVNGTVGTPIPGVFSIYRYSTNGYSSPQTVNFVLGGTATNGVYISSATNSVVIPAGQTNVLVYITPTTNNVPRGSTTVTLSIAGGGGYSSTPPTIDTITIQNTSSQQIVLATLAPSMYKVFSNDFASFTLTRLGDTNAPSYTVSSYTYPSGATAVAGTDYTFPTNITFNPGDLVYTNIIMPLIAGQPPVDTTNPVFTGNLTAIIGLASGSGYAAATNTVSLTSIDKAYTPSTVIWRSDLTDPNEGANWTIAYANNNMANVTSADYEVTFGYNIADPNNIANLSGMIIPPPSGASNVLRITANKQGNSASAGVNAYPNITPLSGNYAVRFNMLEVQGAQPGYATEGPIFGINHGSRGIATNWWTGSGITSYPGGVSNYPGWPADGIWYWIDGAAGGAGAGDYLEFTSISNAFPNSGWQQLATKTYATFINNFKYPVPFNTASAGGVPASESSNATGVTNAAGPWVDVEIKQVNGVVTLTIDKIAIMSYTNTTIWTNGVPMLGFDDPFNSVQNEDGATYYSNIRAVTIGAPVITSVTALAASNSPITIYFTTSDGDDTASSFTLLSNGTNTAAHVDTTVTGVTFTEPTAGMFKATFTKPTNSMQYYRIKHN